MIPLRYLLPWIALAIAACVAPQPPRESAAPAASVETVRMRSLRSDTPCPPEFSGTCYPVWFGTNRKPRDAADLTKGFGGDFRSMSASASFASRRPIAPASSAHRCGGAC